MTGAHSSYEEPTPPPAGSPISPGQQQAEASTAEHEEATASKARSHPRSHFMIILSARLRAAIRSGRNAATASGERMTAPYAGQRRTGIFTGSGRHDQPSRQEAVLAGKLGELGAPTY